MISYLGCRFNQTQALRVDISTNSQSSHVHDDLYYVRRVLIGCSLITQWHSVSNQ